MGNGHRDFPFGYRLGNPPTLRKFLSRIRKAEPCCFGGSYRGLLEPPPWAPPLSHPLPPNPHPRNLTPSRNPGPHPPYQAGIERSPLLSSGLCWNCSREDSRTTCRTCWKAQAECPRGSPGPTSASGNQETHPGATARQGQSLQEGLWDPSPPPFTSANM